MQHVGRVVLNREVSVCYFSSWLIIVDDGIFQRNLFIHCFIWNSILDSVQSVRDVSYSIKAIKITTLGSLTLHHLVKYCSAISIYF